MPYPDPPSLSYDFSAYAQSQGDASFPGQEIDVDLEAIRASIASVIAFLEGFTRSDGMLGNGSVGRDQLATDVRLGFDAPTVWVTGTAYTTTSSVFFGTKFYIATVAHTASASFSTDLASGRWVELADFTPPGSALLQTNNLSDVTDASEARANLGLQIGSDVQAFSARLAELAGVTSTANLTALAALTSIANLISLSGTGMFRITLSGTSDFEIVDQNNDRILAAFDEGSGELYYRGTRFIRGVTGGFELDGNAGGTAFQTTITDADTKVPTSGAVVDYVATKRGANIAVGLELVGYALITDGSSGGFTVAYEQGFSSIARTGAGRYVFTFDSALASANYMVFATPTGSGARVYTESAKTTSAFTVDWLRSTDAGAVDTTFSLMVYRPVS